MSLLGWRSRQVNDIANWSSACVNLGYYSPPPHALTNSITSENIHFTLERESRHICQRVWLYSAQRLVAAVCWSRVIGFRQVSFLGATWSSGSSY